jgi:hypothetical protein
MNEAHHAEPPPSHGGKRDSGTANANGGWLRRLVRPQLVITQKALNHKSQDSEEPLPTPETMLSNHDQNNKNTNTHRTAFARVAKQIKSRDGRSDYEQ